MTIWPSYPNKKQLWSEATTADTSKIEPETGEKRVNSFVIILRHFKKQSAFYHRVPRRAMRWSAKLVSLPPHSKQCWRGRYSPELSTFERLQFPRLPKFSKYCERLNCIQAAKPKSILHNGLIGGITDGSKPQPATV